MSTTKLNLLDEHAAISGAISTVATIFRTSEGRIRPHFILTGPSGSGKTHLIELIAKEFKFNFLEVNAAQLTKEGTAGNSLSKALSPLARTTGLTLCFVDEFDKLFISGNQNSDLAHEVTHGVQNEFLKVLESNTTSVFGDYGKYIPASTEKTLFVFAGAFNGQEDVTLDNLRDYGVKTEFLGRVGLIYNLPKLSIESMRIALENTDLLAEYLRLYHNVRKEDVVNTIMSYVEQNYENNTLGIRMLTNLLHQYFINGGVLTVEKVQQTSFQTPGLTLKPPTLALTPPVVN